MSLELALDALDMVSRFPESPELWQRLCQIQLSLNAEDRIRLVELICDLEFSSSDVNWLKYSALDYITGDLDWRRKQAGLADDSTSPEAIMGLLHFNWGFALQDSASREQFLERINNIDTLRLQALVADKLLISGDKKSGFNSTQPRVAIYTPQLANATHGGTLLMLNLASLLNQAGVDIKIFTSQETVISTPTAYTGGLHMGRPEKLDRNAIRLHGTGNCEARLPDINMSLFSRFKYILQSIEEYSPDIVLFVGFMSPVVHALYKKYPVLGMSVHTACPAVPMDLWLNNLPAKDDEVEPSQGSARATYFPYRFWPKGKTTAFSKSDLRIPEQSMILVTAGYRLDSEIKPPWSRQMLAFLDANKHVYWLLVGVSPEQMKTLEISHDKLRILPPQNNVERCYASGDIYVDTPSIGSGGAVTMAMEQGTPAISFSNTDGGNKVGEFAVASNEDYFKLLDVWVNDADARKQAGNKQKLIFDSRLDISSENAKNDIMQAIRQTIELCNRRMGVSD